MRHVYIVFYSNPGSSVLHVLSVHRTEQGAGKALVLAKQQSEGGVKFTYEERRFEVHE